MRADWGGYAICLSATKKPSARPRFYYVVDTNLGGSKLAHRRAESNNAAQHQPGGCREQPDEAIIATCRAHRPCQCSACRQKRQYAALGNYRDKGTDPEGARDAAT